MQDEDRKTVEQAGSMADYAFEPSLSWDFRQKWPTSRLEGTALVMVRAYQSLRGCCLLDRVIDVQDWMGRMADLPRIMSALALRRAVLHVARGFVIQIFAKPCKV